ncbi:MAG: single-stranded DNA-binding protein [Elusimicrobia bacterium]|nr:single-stranded DNA-binding protein [Elusimicrobiota bacterium]
MIGVRLLEQNQIFLVGRLTHDPEVRYTQKGSAMCRFSIAVNRRYKDSATGEWKDDTSFIPVVVWREVAERCKEKLSKGSPVHVEGRLKSREYDDPKTGSKRTILEVEARRVQFLALAKPADAQAPADRPETAAPSGKKAAGAPAAPSGERSTPSASGDGGPLAAEDGGPAAADDMEEVPF